jgi:hypothetical protein
MDKMKYNPQSVAQNKGSLCRGIAKKQLNFFAKQEWTSE